MPQKSECDETELLDVSNCDEELYFFQLKRWHIAILACFGNLIAFGLRCNFGAAKIRMVNNFTDPYGHKYAQQFFWSPTELGFLESSFFYGYALTQIPGGLLAAKFAPNRLFGISITAAAVLNILLPLALQAQLFTSYTVLIIQFSQGLSLGLSYPAMHGVWRNWAPPMERTKLATTTFTGSYLGVMIGLPLSAYLASYIGWAAPFYFYGMLGIVWSIIWYTVSAPSPEQCQSISNSEKQYIMKHVGNISLASATVSLFLTTIPWKKVFMSLPVWSIVICSFCKSWTLFLMMGNELAYMTQDLHLQIEQGGLIGSIPHALLSITVLLSGQIADYLRSSGRMSTVAVRKLFNTAGFACEASFLFCLAFIASAPLAITILILSVGLGGMSTAGFNVNHFDIAPRYAPILMGFSNGFSALAGVNALVLGYFIASQGVIMGWKMSFLFAACIDIVGLLVFLLFAAGEVQEWAKEEEPHITMEEIIKTFSNVLHRISTVRQKRNARQPLIKEQGKITSVSARTRSNTVPWQMK